MSRSPLRFTVLAAAALVALGFAPELLAQETVQPGYRVRVTTKGPAGPDTEQVIGDVDRLTTDQIFLTSGGQSVVIDQDDVVAIDVSEGQKSNWQKGLLYGVVAGGLVGVIAGVADDSTSVGTAMLIGVGAGGVVGAGIGALIKSEHWMRIPLAEDQAMLGIGRNQVALLIPTRF